MWQPVDGQKHLVSGPLSELEAILSCNWCGKLLVDPITAVECSHTFCRACIEPQIQLAKGNRCPACRSSVPPHDTLLGTDPFKKERLVYDSVLWEWITRVVPRPEVEAEVEAARAQRAQRAAQHAVPQQRAVPQQGTGGHMRPPQQRRTARAVARGPSYAPLLPSDEVLGLMLLPETAAAPTPGLNPDGHPTSAAQLAAKAQRPAAAPSSSSKIGAGAAEVSGDATLLGQGGTEAATAAGDALAGNAADGDLAIREMTAGDAAGPSGNAAGSGAGPSGREGFSNGIPGPSDRSQGKRQASGEAARPAGPSGSGGAPRLGETDAAASAGGFTAGPGTSSDAGGPELRDGGATVAGASGPVAGSGGAAARPLHGAVAGAAEGGAATPVGGATRKATDCAREGGMERMEGMEGGAAAGACPVLERPYLRVPRAMAVRDLQRFVVERLREAGAAGLASKAEVLCCGEIQPPGRTLSQVEEAAWRCRAADPNELMLLHYRLARPPDLDPQPGPQPDHRPQTGPHRESLVPAHSSDAVPASGPKHFSREELEVADGKVAGSSSPDGAEGHSPGGKLRAPSGAPVSRRPPDGDSAVPDSPSPMQIDLEAHESLDTDMPQAGESERDQAGAVPSGFGGQLSSDEATLRTGSPARWVQMGSSELRQK